MTRKNPAPNLTLAEMRTLERAARARRPAKTKTPAKRPAFDWRTMVRDAK